MTDEEIQNYAGLDVDAEDKNTTSLGVFDV
jgi:hypothetical protein